ncbi:putative RiPP precursor [Nocardiopsis sp. NPDC006938]
MLIDLDDAREVILGNGAQDTADLNTSHYY